ncbi:hypothetical protein [Azospirillum halopraeferens]|uniref:hypothetical protein n=1 Tax=Azospirillum halopraeferens TaxID=34010 RepID=UPI00040690BF|nr:hypothetical protein [Azospirillum halopraeferens]
MKRLAALDSGTYYHRETLYGERYRHHFDRILYARDVGAADLSDVDVLFVTCRTDPSLLVPHCDRIAAFLERGGTVVAMGSTGPHHWLPGVEWTDTATNFWWWLTPGADPGLRVASPDHALWRHIALSDATWHHHGHFAPPPGAETVIALESGGAILYDDRTTTPGRMIVTALDPCYHHGSFFMPATTRFLDGFLPWLRGGG